MQQIGQLFSYETIYSFLKKEDNKNSTAKTTIISYIKALNEANLLSTIERYNIIGKELMAYKTKYYAYDIGIRNAVVDN
jgi:predicted AAA+ superfamily ATPase